MELPRQPTAVVFDMDGLLFDTESLYQEAGGLAARDMGHELTPDLFRSLVGLPWPQATTLLVKHFGPSFPVDVFSNGWRGHFNAIVETRLVLKPGVLELLDALDALGLPRAIATSSSHKTVRHHLSFHDLGARFHHVVAQGDYAAGKPAPDPYLKAAERLGVEPQFCLALEDSHNGVRSASAAGMMTIMVPDLLEATDEIRGLCTFVVRDLHAVRSLMLSRMPR
ncbi:MAG: HAD family phosphatase [Rhodospirillales bacterium]|nr:HAD family phosphatase [Rhodospirillales bacterium]